jgi:hypothetical protein
MTSRKCWECGLSFIGVDLIMNKTSQGSYPIQIKDQPDRPISSAYTLPCVIWPALPDVESGSTVAMAK